MLEVPSVLSANIRPVRSITKEVEGVQVGYQYTSIIVRGIPSSQGANVIYFVKFANSVLSDLTLN